MAFREILLPWRGSEYHCTPSLRLLQRCEQRGLRLSRLINSLSEGDPEIAMTCMLAGELLRDGGASVADEDIYGELMAGNCWDTLIVPIVNALAPEPDAKKPVAQLAG